jgi:hypothetical protein
LGILLHEVIRDGSLKFRNYLVEAANLGVPPAESLFVVELDTVEQGTKEDARDFFDRTELTNNQRDLLRKILLKMSGKRGSAGAFLLDTVMGGGKSHTLGYIYYMFKFKSISSARQEIRDILNDLDISQIPDAEIVLINGMNLDPNVPLNKHPKFAEFFKKGGTKDEVVQAIEDRGKPVVFIIDELIEYFHKRGGLFDSGRDIYLRADLSYLRTLVEGVVSSGSSVLIMTIPSDSSDPVKYNEITKIFQTISKYETIVHPLDEVTDLPKIIRKQFIESMKERLPKQAANWVSNIYKGMGEHINDNEFEDYYPFNPRLIKDIFINELSRYRNFKKTRQTLTILAKALSDIISRALKEEFESPFINAGDINLESIKDIITSENLFEQRNLQIILDTDILIRDIKPIERRLATTTYLYSLDTDKIRSGADITTLFDANPSNKLGRSDYKKAMEDYYRTRTIYLHYNKENTRYRFETFPNIWSVIRREAEKIQDCSKLINSWFGELNMGDEVEVIYSENPEANLNLYRVNLAVIPYTIFQDASIDEEVNEFLNRKGLFSTVRQCLNSVVALYPVSKNSLDTLLDWAKQSMAVQELKKTNKNNKQLLNALEESSEEIQVSFTNSIIACYSKVIFDREGERVEHELKLRERKSEAFVDALTSLLSNEEKVFFDENVEKGEFNTESFFDRLLGERSELKVSQAYEAVRTNTNLPFLPYKAFQKAILQAVKEGKIGLASVPTEAGDLSEVSILRNPDTVKEEYYILSKERLKYIEKELEQRKRTPETVRDIVMPPQHSPERQQVVTETPEKKEEEVLIEIKENAALVEKDKVTKFSKDIERVWRLSEWSTKQYEIGLTITSGSDKITLATSTSKLSQVRQLIEELSKTFDKQDINITLSAKLPSQLIEEVKKQQ